MNNEFDNNKIENFVRKDFKRKRTFKRKKTLKKKQTIPKKLLFLSFQINAFKKTIKKYQKIPPIITYYKSKINSILYIKHSSLRLKYQEMLLNIDNIEFLTEMFFPMESNKKLKKFFYLYKCTKKIFPNYFANTNFIYNIMSKNLNDKQNIINHEQAKQCDINLRKNFNGNYVYTWINNFSNFLELSEESGENLKYNNISDSFSNNLNKSDESIYEIENIIFNIELAEDNENSDLIDIKKSRKPSKKVKKIEKIFQLYDFIKKSKTKDEKHFNFKLNDENNKIFDNEIINESVNEEDKNKKVSFYVPKDNPKFAKLSSFRNNLRNKRIERKYFINLLSNTINSFESSINNNINNNNNNNNYLTFNNTSNKNSFNFPNINNTSINNRKNINNIINNNNNKKKILLPYNKKETGLSKIKNMLINNKIKNNPIKLKNSRNFINNINLNKDKKFINIFNKIRNNSYNFHSNISNKSFYNNNNININNKFITQNLSHLTYYYILK